MENGGIEEPCPFELRICRNIWNEEGFSQWVSLTGMPRLSGEMKRTKDTVIGGISILQPHMAGLSLSGGSPWHPCGDADSPSRDRGRGMVAKCEMLRDFPRKIGTDRRPRRAPIVQNSALPSCPIHKDTAVGTWRSREGPVCEKGRIIVFGTVEKGKSHVEFLQTPLLGAVGGPRRLPTDQPALSHLPCAEVS